MQRESYQVRLTQDLKTFQGGYQQFNLIAAAGAGSKEILFVSEAAARRGGYRILEENSTDRSLIGDAEVREPDKAERTGKTRGRLWSPLIPALFREEEKLAERRTKVKICGLGRTEDIFYVSEAYVDYEARLRKSRRQGGAVPGGRPSRRLLRREYARVGVFVESKAGGDTQAPA